MISYKFSLSELKNNQNEVNVVTSLNHLDSLFPLIIIKCPSLTLVVF